MTEAGQHKGKGNKKLGWFWRQVATQTDIWYSFFGEPGSLNDLNVLEKSMIVQAILTGKLDLQLPPDDHYTINGVVRDYIYFLVDGIYLAWPIFISTISNAEP